MFLKRRNSLLKQLHQQAIATIQIKLTKTMPFTVIPNIYIMTSVHNPTTLDLIPTLLV